MSYLRNVKVSFKLALGFSLCLAFSAILGGVAINRMLGLNSITHEIVTNSFGPVLKFAHFRYMARQVRTDEYLDLVASTPDEKTLAEANIATDFSKAKDAISSYLETVTDP